ncbi:hypothetical protein ACF07Y_28835 [Streptomyces sp. NPDC016566]|uniref:hypothetical protein n=1 Tax=Streptomyces sp. NPDC016566 TaxID=3364967 RepID=UPI0036FCF830
MPQGFLRVGAERFRGTPRGGEDSCATEEATEKGPTTRFAQVGLPGGEPEDLADLQAEEEDEAPDHSRGKRGGLVLYASSELLQALVILDEGAGLFHRALLAQSTVQQLPYS